MFPLDLLARFTNLGLFFPKFLSLLMAKLELVFGFRFLLPNFPFCSRVNYNLVSTTLIA